MAYPTPIPKKFQPAAKTLRTWRANPVFFRDNMGMCRVRFGCEQETHPSWHPRGDKYTTSYRLAIYKFQGATWQWVASTKQMPDKVTTDALINQAKELNRQRKVPVCVIALWNDEQFFLTGSGIVLNEQANETLSKRFKI